MYTVVTAPPPSSAFPGIWHHGDFVEHARQPTALPPGPDSAPAAFDPTMLQCETQLGPKTLRSRNGFSPTRGVSAHEKSLENFWTNEVLQKYLLNYD